MEWSVNDVADLLGGEWITPNDAAARSVLIAGVSIDSRTIKLGELFIAITGERFDGGAFVDDALKAGAAMAVVRSGYSSKDTENKAILRVGNTFEALWALARAHRGALTKTCVVAVTGSNGKTTTCRLLDAALSGRLSGRVSPRSFNNHIGTPLTILSALSSDDYLICEIGSNAPGEIAALAALVKPDIGVIANIGRAHLGGFGSVEAIAREKGSLAHAVIADGLILAPSGCELLDKMMVGASAEIRRVGVVVCDGDSRQTQHESACADVVIVSIEHDRRDSADLLRITLGDGGVFEAPTTGRHNAGNIACAVAVARQMGVDDEAIRAGLLAAQLPPMRLERIRIAGVDVFNDAYNASPESMSAAIDAFAELSRDAKRRVLILGDMLELGDGAPAAHREVIERAIAEPGFDRMIVIGPQMEKAAREAPDDPRLSSVGELTEMKIANVVAEINAGDAVLLKGSRLMRLERVADALQGRDAGEVSSSAEG